MPWIKTKDKTKTKFQSNNTVILKNEKALSVIQKENVLLKKRILETSETFFSQAKFFNSLLTLNEIHLIQGVVESSAQFLNATKTSFYQFDSKDSSFSKSVTFQKSKGLQLSVDVTADDRILYLIKESHNLLTIREILHNKMLYKLWQNSTSKALIYCPLFLGKKLIGILTVDEIKFHHLNRQTVKNLMVISKMTSTALKNVKSYQSAVLERNQVQSKILSEYQEFLKTLNFEFKKAKRNELPLSTIYVVLEPKQDVKIFEKDGVLLKEKIRNSCRKNLRDIDLLFDDTKPGRFWILLPMTDFNGLAYVMERLNLLVNMELASQSNYLCHIGFGSMDQDIKQPKQMMETCRESYQLHRTVRALISKKKEYKFDQPKSKTSNL